MDLEIKQLSNVGTSNPITARLSIQTSELIKLFPLTDKQKEDIFGLLGMEVNERLVTCYKIYSQLQEQLIKVNQTNKDAYFRGNVVRTPAVMDLRNLCENFLYQAKSILRDLLGIFNIFYNKEFSKPQFDLAYKWAKEKFGEQDNLTKILKDDHDTWIRRIVSMRNAIEHPGGYSGHLKINNIMFINKNIPDMATFIENTLGLCEDILVILLEKLPKDDIPLIIYEIPVEERDVDCPIRFKVSLHPDYLKQLEN
jgi:hypothetical protein